MHEEKKMYKAAGTTLFGCGGFVWNSGSKKITNQIPTFVFNTGEA